LLLGAEMNAVIEHMSAEGKDKGGKDPQDDTPAVDRTDTETKADKASETTPVQPTVRPHP
jgi:membrane protein